MTALNKKLFTIRAAHWLGNLANALCNCGYLLPSNTALDPADHELYCPYRIKALGETAEPTPEPELPPNYPQRPEIDHCPFCGRFPYETVGGPSAVFRLVTCCRAGDYFINGRLSKEEAQKVHANPSLILCWSCNKLAEFGPAGTCPECGENEIPF